MYSSKLAEIRVLTNNINLIHVNVIQVGQYNLSGLRMMRPLNHLLQLASKTIALCFECCLASKSLVSMHLDCYSFVWRYPECDSHSELIRQGYALGTTRFVEPRGRNVAISADVHALALGDMNRTEGIFGRPSRVAAEGSPRACSQVVGLYCFVKVI